MVSFVRGLENIMASNLLMYSWDEGKKLGRGYGITNYIEDVF